MYTLRSTTRAASSSPVKRKAQDLSDESGSESFPQKPRSPKKSKGLQSASSLDVDFIVPPPPAPEASPTVSLVPATLTFSFEEAKAHLVNADPRFTQVFASIPCKPFEHLEHLHPFHALVNSILGQQISWMAARSIKHKFLRLYDSSIPQDLANYDSKSPNAYFPEPIRVAGTEIATLRSAGLSARKAEYIKDLAQRFSDGRLSTEKLLFATDEDLSEMLTAVRGIGPWTVDMFAMFSLRRPNILPVGDLGVQRGLLRWTLAMHNSDFKITVEEKKLPRPPDEDEEKPRPSTPPPPQDIAEAPNEDASSIVPTAVIQTPKKSRTKKSGGRPELPPPMTPSTRRILHDHLIQDDNSLPEGLTVAEMKSRLNGKKKIKGALLTPGEMEQLTEKWKPYRSLGVYYMWALSEDT